MYRTIQDVKAANGAAGFHFFEPATLRFFDSRIGKRLYSGRYFITSERFRGMGMTQDGPRLYTIREVMPDGSVDTVGDFQGYKTSDAAERAIWRREQMDAAAQVIA